jgi:hypothetical protein
VGKNHCLGMGVGGGTHWSSSADISSRKRVLRTMSRSLFACISSASILPPRGQSRSGGSVGFETLQMHGSTYSATVCFVVRARNWVRSCFSCHSATKESLFALQKPGQSESVRFFCTRALYRRVGAMVSLCCVLRLGLDASVLLPPFHRKSVSGFCGSKP